ncbi:hypothetical protein BDB00DRAFT_811705 [Zychaea mexicana]|uniref:uncharacterized protein n=1 Tax=Zychaea mexicana TaxID=64656 RepID=UPI0022FEC5C3|nr:uncharacterized protein BDB00DRAFT_811705 [Zychaea mexicana]KAI9495787.1 hypothetical protein BDB00DRAFT_811705 [Zychaea mexicana]
MAPTAATTTTSRSIMERLAPEMLLHILSFMPLTEAYRIRSVCRTWQNMAEEFIYMSIKTQQRKVYLRIGDKSRKLSVELNPHSYDPVNRIVEFRPHPNAALVPMMVDASNPWSTCHRRMQIHFSDWMPNGGPSSFAASTALLSSDMSPADQALMLFHLQYNPAVERLYELPPWSTTVSDVHGGEHYVGDKGLILALSYAQEGAPAVNSSYYYAYPSSNTSVPTMQAPRMEPHWLRVTLGWIMSGLEPEIMPTQIYPQRYAHLGHALARRGFFKYDPLSEPVLSHIVHLQEEQRPLTPSLHPVTMTTTQQPYFPTVHDMHSFHHDNASSAARNTDNKSNTGDLDNATDDLVTPALLDYVQCHTHECHTRLSRLQHMLEGAGVDARVLWKYTFAKSYVVGNGSLLGEEDVVRRIQDSEEEWRFKRVSLIRRLGLAA